MSLPLPPVTYTILDGGMGTTLEDSGHDVSSHLWSSDPKLRGAVRDVHKGFLEAGAVMVGTATYQACESLYTANDLMSPFQAEEMMRSQVGVAQEAVTTTVTTGGKIGLCLGPFGATLQPGQEYSGLYPPPHGPSASSTQTDSPQTTSTCISSLRQFHLDRLLTYARDESTWRTIDWVCFETIPLVREGLAIRSAMKGLWRELRGTYGGEVGEEAGCWWMKPFWMAYVFPKGVFPDGSDVRGVVRTSILRDPYQSMGVDRMSAGDRDEDDLPTPNAIGINCTSPAHIHQLGSEFTRYLDEIMDEETSDPTRPRQLSIGFVLYPDGGLVYDTTTRSWSAPSTTDVVAGSSGNGNWAENVAKVARRIGETTRSTSTGEVERVWKEGVLVGGCCKNGFEEIRGLARALTEVTTTTKATSKVE